jgi:hypothetical protein
VWFEHDVVTHNRQSRTRTNIFPPSEFASQSSTRHHSKVAPCFTHNCSSGWTHDEQSASKIVRRTYVGAGQDYVEVPEKPRSEPIPATIEVIRKTKEKNTQKRRMKEEPT